MSFVIAMEKKISKSYKGTKPLKLTKDDIDLLRFLQGQFKIHFRPLTFSKGTQLRQIAEVLLPNKNIKDNIQKDINSALPLINFMINKHKV
ncbi:MAG: hypothetical protein QM504_17910 [Pseudomonadota bacterium]